MQGLRAELQHPSSTLDVSQSAAAGCFNSSSEGSGTLMLLPLLRLLTKSTRLTMTRNAVWALSNLCRGKNPPPAFEKVTFVEVANLDLPLMLHVFQVSPCLPVLSRLLFSSDPDLLADACWALSYLSDGPNDKIQAVIDSGVCRRLVELLM